jgi:prolyl-tRNA synthetase
MFNDMELIGIPYRLVIGERGLDEGQLEFRARTAQENESIAIDGAIESILERIGTD